jgi:RNA polymerase sigma-B factor
MPGHEWVPVTVDSVLEDLDVAALAYAERAATAADAERGALRDELTRRCLPFAGRLARRYRGRGESFEDIEQVARLGLVKAIDRYDPERGSFTAYAMITISGEIKRHFRDKTWGVHVPRRLQDLSLEVGHASMVLTSTLSRAPTPDEVAERLNVPLEAVLEAMESAAGYSPSSLNAPVGSDGFGEFGDLIGDPDRALDMVDDRLTVAELLLLLPVRERQLIAMRFYGNRTQAEIAAELGVSQMHVSRLLTRVLYWLRQAMLSDVRPRWEYGPDVRAEHQDVTISVQRGGGVLRVTVGGEVDRDSVSRLRMRLREAVSEARPDRLVVDLSAVSLVDAAGVAVLLDAASAAAVADVPLSLTGAQPYVARVLAMSGMTPLLADGDAAPRKPGGDC